MQDENGTKGIPATRIWWERTKKEFVTQDLFLQYSRPMSVEAALSYVRTGHTAWVKREDMQKVLDALKGEG